MSSLEKIQASPVPEKAPVLKEGDTVSIPRSKEGRTLARVVVVVGNKVLVEWIERGQKMEKLLPSISVRLQPQPSEARVTAESNLTLKAGEKVFIKRTDDSITVGTATTVDNNTAGKVEVTWEVDGVSYSKSVEIAAAHKVTAESVAEIYGVGKVVSIPRSNGKRSNITISESLLHVSGESVILFWEENGQRANKSVSFNDIGLPLAEELSLPEQKVEAVVSDSEVEKVDFHDLEQRNAYYNEVRLLVEEATDESKKVLQKRDEFTGTGEWPNYHRVGLQAAENARIFYRRNFTTQFNRLESLLQPTNQEDLVQAGLSPVEIFEREESKEVLIDSLTVQINTSYNLIQKQIDLVRDAVREADEALPVLVELQIAETIPTEPMVTAEALPTELTSEPINITVENVDSLTLHEQIAAYVMKVQEVSRQVNERLAKFSPGHIGAEKHQKLVAVHDRLVHLSDRLQERLNETDETILKLKVPKAIKWVQEDLASVQIMVAEAEASALAAAVFENDESSEIPATDVDADTNVETVTESVSPFARQSLPGYKTDSVNFSPLEADQNSNKNLSFREEAAVVDLNEEAELFNRANTIARNSTIPVMNTSEVVIPDVVTQKLEPLTLSEEMRVTKVADETEKISPLILKNELSPLVPEVLGEILNQIPDLTAETVNAVIETSLEQLNKIHPEGLMPEKHVLVAEVHRLGKNIAGRKIIRGWRNGSTPIRDTRLSRLEKADSRDLATISDLLQTLLHPEPITEVPPVAAEVVPTIEVFPHTAVSAAVESITALAEKDVPPVEKISVGEFSELQRLKNVYRDALIYAIKVKKDLKNNATFARANDYEKFAQGAEDAVLSARENYQRVAVRFSVLPTAEIAALEAAESTGDKKRNRLKWVAGALALGLGIFASEKSGDGTIKTTRMSEAPHTASESPAALSSLKLEGVTTSEALIRPIATVESIVPPLPAVSAYDAAYPPAVESENALTFGDTITGTVEGSHATVLGRPDVPVSDNTFVPHADRWGSVEREAPNALEHIPALSTHDFKHGEGLIKVGRGVTEVGALGIMEHVSAKQRESVIDLTVARIAQNPALQAELNVGIDTATSDVFIYAGRPLNVTAFERELANTAKATGVYVDRVEMASSLIPPRRPSSVEVTPIAASASETVLPQNEIAPAVTLQNLNAFIQNFEQGPAALVDTVAKWAEKAEGAYFIAPGNRILSMFSQQEYVDPYKALASKSISEILDLKNNKNILALSQKLNEWHISGEGFNLWADKLEKFVRHFDVRGAGDLTLEGAANLMYADAELSKTSNIPATI